MRPILFVTMIMFFCMNSVFAQVNPMQSSPIIAQYFGIWTERGQTWEQKFRADTPFDKLNRLYIAFGKVIKTADGNFSIDFDGEASRVQAIISQVRALNPRAEIFLTVGGTDATTSFGGAAKNAAFAENVLHFLMQYGFNGLDIDWEIGLDKSDLNLLVMQLSSTLHPHGFKLTLDVWPFVSDAYDMNILKNNLDQINIMSYGAMTDLSDCVRAYEHQGFPANKIIGGIETERNYAQLNGNVDSLGPNGTIAKKAQYALLHPLAGMMEWRLDNDYAAIKNSNYATYQGAQELWIDMNK